MALGEGRSHQSGSMPPDAALHPVDGLVVRRGVIAAAGAVRVRCAAVLEHFVKSCQSGCEVAMREPKSHRPSKEAPSTVPGLRSVENRGV